MSGEGVYSGCVVGALDAVPQRAVFGRALGAAHGHLGSDAVKEEAKEVRRAAPESAEHSEQGQGAFPDQGVDVDALLLGHLTL